MPRSERLVGRKPQFALVSREIDAARLEGCTYKVTPATVTTTTRDGWMIVSWGDMAAAFRSSKAHADGSFLRTTATATYVGLQAFDRTDGASMTIAAFALAE